MLRKHIILTDNVWDNSILYYLFYALWLGDKMCLMNNVTTCHKVQSYMLSILFERYFAPFRGQLSMCFTLGLTVHVENSKLFNTLEITTNMCWRCDLTMFFPLVPNFRAFLEMESHSKWVITNFVRYIHKVIWCSILEIENTLSSHMFHKEITVSLIEEGIFFLFDSCAFSKYFYNTFCCHFSWWRRW